jgi:hypothetical protein
VSDETKWSVFNGLVVPVEKPAVNLAEPLLQQLADMVDANGSAPELFQFQRNGRTYVLEVYSVLDHSIRQANNLGAIN